MSASGMTATTRPAWARVFAAAVVVLVGLALPGCGAASSGDAATAPEPATAASHEDADGVGAEADGAPGEPDAASDDARDAEVVDDGAPDDAAASGSVPDGWPEAVTFVPGTIVDGFAVSGGHYMVTLALTEGGRAVFDAGADLLEQAGHSEVFRLVDDEESQSGNWTGDGYSVTLNVSTTGGEWFADYVVAMDSAG